MKIEFEWENLPDDCPGEMSYRAKVIGGWIVKSIHYGSTKQENNPEFHPDYCSCTSIFVPDIDHEWEIENE